MFTALSLRKMPWFCESRARDNVLLEYGLFAAKLGIQRCIACRVDAAKTSSDLAGITLVNISDRNSLYALLSVQEWVRKLKLDDPLSKLSSAEPKTCQTAYRALQPHEIADRMNSLTAWTVENSESSIELILIPFQVETNYPWPGRETAHCFSISRHSREASFKLIDDSLHGLECAIGKFLFTQFIPDMLLGVEFR